MTNTDRRTTRSHAPYLERAVLAPAAAGLLLSIGGLATAAGWFRWSTLALWMWSNVGWLALVCAGTVLLGIAAARVVGRPRQSRPARWSWWVIAAAGLIVVGVTWGAIVWLVQEAEAAKDAPAAKVEAIKAGLGVGAAAGGMFALLVAVRRQWHQEVSTSAIELDAAEKRVTELYTKAVEQLGSEKAPVRLAGLYALERVAQNNPDQRQTVVNVWCAYMRMPYEDPDRLGRDERSGEDYRERVQEREVRLTAQRLLTEHLYRGDEEVTADDKYWSDITLDLTGAFLIDFTLTNCMARSVTFQSTIFSGDADFRATNFVRDADFRSASFSGKADFEATIFTGDADFRATKFVGDADFRLASFNGNADFESAVFAAATDFRSTTFVGEPYDIASRTCAYTDFWRVTFSHGVPNQLAPFWSAPSVRGNSVALDDGERSKK